MCCELRTDDRTGYYPRLILLLPNIIVLAIIIVAHPPRPSSEGRVTITEQIKSPPRTNARDGSTEWLANLQGLQNLMGLMYVITSIS